MWKIPFWNHPYEIYTTVGRFGVWAHRDKKASYDFYVSKGITRVWLQHRNTRLVGSYFAASSTEHGGHQPLTAWVPLLLFYQLLCLSYCFWLGFTFNVTLSAQWRSVWLYIKTFCRSVWLRSFSLKTSCLNWVAGHDLICSDFLLLRNVIHR